MYQVWNIQTELKGISNTACVVPSLDGPVRVPFAVVNDDILDVVAYGFREGMVLAPPLLVVFLHRPF